MGPVVTLTIKTCNIYVFNSEEWCRKTLSSSLDNVFIHLTSEMKFSRLLYDLMGQPPLCEKNWETWQKTDFRFLILDFWWRHHWIGILITNNVKIPRLIKCGFIPYTSLSFMQSIDLECLSIFLSSFISIWACF